MDIMIGVALGLLIGGLLICLLSGQASNPTLVLVLLFVPSVASGYAPPSPAFNGHVDHVVRLRAEKQVSRVDAEPVADIAGKVIPVTVVKDAQAIRDRSSEEFVGDPAGYVMASAGFDGAVTLTVSAASPQNAPGGSLATDMVEEKVNQRGGLPSLLARLGTEPTAAKSDFAGVGDKWERLPASFACASGAALR